MGCPDIENRDYAQLLAVVPCFMADGVFEDRQLAGLADMGFPASRSPQVGLPVQFRELPSRFACGGLDIELESRVGRKQIIELFQYRR
jgi:hypothetical protein